MPIAPFIRIGLRYVAGALIANGWLDPQDGLAFATDPDVYAAVEVLAGLLIAAATEGAYALARRFGWSK